MSQLIVTDNSIITKVGATKVTVTPGKIKLTVKD